MSIRIGSDITVATYRFPTPYPEADGTLSWDSTTAVLVSIPAGEQRGIGWTYSSPAAAVVIEQHLAPLLRGRPAADVTACWIEMCRACRNFGFTGVVAHAVSAVDIAMWDLKARLLGVPLTTLFGAVRPATPVYGSGGFTTLTDDQLAAQIIDWRSAGCTAMKIKIGARFGAEITRDLERITRTRQLAGAHTRIMVDANGAYTVGQARRVGADLDRLGVEWFEEPVSSDDLKGLQAVRNSVRCDIAAGEYVYTSYDAAALIDVVDCLQLDVTRCGGYTGFLRCAALAAAHGTEVSAHCAPSLHAPIAAAVPNLRHVEWFADHARLEPQLVDGTPPVTHGLLTAAARDGQDPGDTHGHGMRLAQTAARYLLPSPAADERGEPSG
ncbi:enolase C-terminal domain-like protein [Nocardia sp. CA-119907]|uniref:enolase C-terminal domain-like protein n=1 Tax=Nocardia sp. CA-119907 TaxID=3239973 RepID=UPI003D979BEF